MKKIIKTFLIIYLFFGFISYVHAETYALNEDESQNGEPVVPDNALIIGTHLITDSSKASTQLIMDATQTIVGDDAVIFQKILDKEEADEEYLEGWWINAISGDDIVPANVDGLICITHLNGDEVEDPDCDATRFTVTFNGLAGDQADKTVSIVNGEKIAAADIPTPKTKKGYEFVCWVKDDTANEDHSSCYDFSQTISESVTLNPYYDLIKYKIHFDLNGLDSSSQELSDQTCTIEELADPEGSNCTLPNVNEVRKGYKFDGWSTVKDETGEKGTHFEANKSMADMLGNEELGDDYYITLYAVWTPQLYTITYNLNGGTYQNQTVVKSSYSVLTRENIELFTPSRTGYTFSGWEATEHSEDDKVTGPEEADGKYKLTVSEDHLENLTLTAKWKEKEFTITYDLNLENYPEMTNVSANNKAYATLLAENLVKPGDTTCKFETECKLAEAPTRDDYIFAGWADSNGYLYTGGNSYTGVDFGDDKKQVELTAQWNAKNEPLYKIEYNLDGGSFAGEAVEQYGRKTIDTQLPVPTKIGYKFKGWCSDEQKTDNNCKENAQIKSFLEGDGADPKNLKDLTLYAKWEANNYTVEFYEPKDISAVQLALMSDGGPDDGFEQLDGEQTKNCTYDTVCALGNHKTHFDDKNEILRGWALSYGEKTNNNNVYLSDNISVKNLTSTENGVVKLYAVAEAVEYTITYYLDGGQFKEPSEGEPKTKVTKGEKVKIPNPTKDGYTFGGWEDEDGQPVPGDDADADRQDENIEVTVNKNLVLIAKWKKDAEWSLNIFLDGGTFSEDKSDLTTKKYKDNEEIEIPNPKKDGYTFVGWVDQDGQDVKGETEKPDKPDSIKVKIKSDLFLIAKWKQNNPELNLTLEKSTSANNQITYQYKIGVKSNNRKGFRTKLKLTILKSSQKSNATNSDVEVYYGDRTPTVDKTLEATLKQDFNNGSVIISPQKGIILGEKLEKYLTILVKNPDTYYFKLELVDYNDENTVYASVEKTAVSASGQVEVPLQKSSP